MIGKHVNAGADKVLKGRTTLPFTINSRISDNNKIVLSMSGPAVELKQADRVTALVFELVRDNNGLVIEIKPVSSALSHGVDEVLPSPTNFLEHHGVKGMKWGHRKSAAERRHERTVRVQEKAAESIAKSNELRARAEARTAKADAKTAAATAKLETKVAKKEAALAKTEARIGVDDPTNAYVRPSSGIAGKTDAQSVRLRADAAKAARTLDDATLKAYTQRIDTEKKLKQAIAEDSAPRKTAAKKLINEAGKEMAKKALVGVGSMAVFYGLSRMSKTHTFKLNPEGMAGLLSGKGKTSGADAFTKVDKMAELAGGMKVPMSEIAKWKKPPSMGPKATPF